MILNKLGSTHILFLERLCDMFETMSMQLPAYEEYTTAMRDRARQQSKNTPDRLLKALTYIYTDLIQFCFDAYKLLSKKRPSMFFHRLSVFSLLLAELLCLKSPFANSLNWKTFDVRYDELLKRWDEHKEAMDIEMRVSSHIEQMQSTTRLEGMLRRIEEIWGNTNEHTAALESKAIGRYSKLFNGLFRGLIGHETFDCAS